MKTWVYIDINVLIRYKTMFRSIENDKSIDNFDRLTLSRDLDIIDVFYLLRNNLEISKYRNQF